MRIPARFFLVVAAALTMTSLVPAEGREITLARRIVAQRAIERLYYAHQVGAIDPFDSARPPAFLEERARRTLRLSAALDSIWHTPITADMLWNETERIARDTRFPDRLREIYAALGNDPVLFQETVARASLAERLARDAFARDERLQGDARREATDLADRLRTGALKPGASHPRLSLVDVLLDRHVTDRGDPFTGYELAALRPEGLLRLSPADFETLRTDLARGDLARADITFAGAPVVTLRDTGAANVVRAPLSVDRDAGTLKVALYVVPKPSWDGFWAEQSKNLDAIPIPTVARADRALPEPTAAVACDVGGFWANGRLGTPRPDYIPGATAVWTGTEMIIWGGGPITNRPDTLGGVRAGSRYDPLTDTWHPTTYTNAPTHRFGHTAVWTGSRMLIVGGSSGPCGGPGFFTCSQGGGRSYDPITDTWRPFGTTGGGPGIRDHHFAVWTGSLMLVWGGESVSFTNVRTLLNSGSRYDPSTDAWSPMSVVNAPAGRMNGTAVWTGSKMIVWGGSDSSNTVNTGGRYDPQTDTWETMTTTNAPAARYGHGAAWAGQEMLIWGGATTGVGPVVFSNGSRYDPVLDQWTAMADLDAPSARKFPTAVWSGLELLVWGGSNSPNGSGTLGNGARYDPVLDRWNPISTTGAPGPRSGHVSVWTGDRLLIWGGLDSSGFEPVGNGRYDPATDSWTPIDNRFVPHARNTHSAVWTGTLMLVTGAYDTSDHGRYDPLLDTWTPTSMFQSAIGQRSAVWTGQEMLVWGGWSGGLGGGVVALGTRYNPVTDVWQSMPSLNAPSARVGHTAVWTGSLMVVWGGQDASNVRLSSGARFNPSTNTWTAMSTVPAPVERSSHTAIWTGSRMIVWGGTPNGGPTVSNTGEIYDPVNNLWVGTTSLIQAPVSRRSHAAVWTGTEMLIWGGLDFSDPLNTGALYNPGNNTWRPMSSVHAPVGGATAVTWTGTKMLAWGAGAVGFGAGGQYDVASDTWTAIPNQDAPAPRGGNTAVQADSALIVWGGGSSEAVGGSTSGVYKTGGLYCPCATGASLFRDTDGDGYGDAAAAVLSCGPLAGYVADGGDCNDTSAGVWRVPSEASLLLFDDATHLIWTVPNDYGGAAAPLYDLVRSDGPDFNAGGACFASDLAMDSFEDTEVPALGHFFYYRVRAGNSCGEGVLGYSSGGVPVTGAPACP